MRKSTALGTISSVHSPRMTAEDRWEDGGAYERFMGRWSRQAATEFLTWLDVAPGRRWLDVGCGTGALLEAIAAERSPSALVAVDPAEDYVAAAAARLGARAHVRVGDARALPFAADEFDVVVSGLVLNFVPDPVAAVSEMRRVTRPGGTVAAYVWDYAEGMQFLRYFWDAAIEVDPAARSADEGVRFPISRPDPLADVFRSAGLSQVKGGEIEVPTIFRDFDDYWMPFVGGPGPAPGYVAAVTETQRNRLRERLRASLPAQANGAIALTARAWCVRGETSP